MLITDSFDRDGWREVARELEPLFGTPMADDNQFLEYIDRKIAAKEAIAAVDRMSERRVAGVIAFSVKKNSISWFGVREEYRGRGLGRRLLGCAANQLDRSEDIEVVTFTAEEPGGAAGRALYLSAGFREDEKDLVRHGFRRSKFLLPADSAARTGGSFHYNIKRYTDWSAPSGCPVCRDESATPGYVEIKELEHSWVGANSEAQGTLWGKCSVLAKRHAVELFDLSITELTDFMADVRLAAGALKIVSGAVKINYELHGNSVPHLHAHLFPRYLDDLFPSGPIDYRITEPSPYLPGEFDFFVNSMRTELAHGTGRSL